jgi:protein-S-isoprenylcysteine O-methyltransferase Ste14
VPDHPPGIAKAYFAVQAVLAAAWCAALFLHDGIRVATLGNVEPAVLVLPDLLFFTLPSVLAATLVPGSRPLKIALAVLFAYSGLALIYFGWRSLDGGRGAWGVIAMAFAFTGSALAATWLAMGPLGAGRCFPSPLRIRPAAEASTTRHLVRTFLQIVFFWGLFLGVLPWAIRGLESRWNLRWAPLSGDGIAIVGWILFATQGIFGLWSAAVMVVRGRGTPLPSETARELVTSGPYSVVRNPMAVAGILQGVGIGLVHGSWLAVAYALTGSVVWNTLARPYEEAELHARFGTAYEDYRRRVRCWIPGIGS